MCKTRALVTAYALMGLLTFGYSFNVDHKPGNQFVSAEEVSTVGAMMAGLAWPLYWSVAAFRPLRRSA